MNTRELVEDLIETFEIVLNDPDGELGIEEIQAYATLLLARASMR
jgi:hypothetical protein